ncbi:HEPN domain-containing protein [Candidatus Woesearchaeota archaeon]|nr:HEPN domain-containing protein [Candidatus Woesearchaeota archaeon]
MGHLENKLDWCLKKAEKEGDKHRGLKNVPPSREKAGEHIQKAEHNLKAIEYFAAGGFSDWAISAAFYSLYHCLLAVLAKFGYESRNQECTFAAIEHLIAEKSLLLSLNEVKEIAHFSQQSEAGEKIISLREKFQYGTRTEVQNTVIDELKRKAMEFLEKVKEIMGGI